MFLNAPNSDILFAVSSRVCWAPATVKGGVIELRTGEEADAVIAGRNVAYRPPGSRDVHTC
jgi:hypothetical protein